MKEINEEDIFYTGVDEEDYDFLNENDNIDSYDWEKLFIGMYEHWVDNTERYTPFAYLQKFLFPIHSYSKRIACVRQLQNVVLDVVDNEYAMKEWSDDCVSYIRYNERLRELKERNIKPIPLFISKVFWLDEIALLMQHISAQDMIAFIAHTGQIRDLLSIKRDPKYFVTFYSIIYRDNSSAGVGNMPLMEFCREFSSVEEYRCRIMRGHREKVPITPVPVKCRTECFNIYIDERIKHLKEEIMEHDRLRPYDPSEIECMQLMYEHDKPIVDASNVIHEDVDVKEWLNNLLNNPDLEEISEKRCDLKIEQLNAAYGGPFKSLTMDEVRDSVKDHLDNLLLLLNSYIRLLEDRINKAIATSANIPESDKPTKKDLEDLFTYAYRQTSSYSLLIDTLLKEKLKVGKNADADWRRHALVLHESRKKIMTNKCPHQFNDWLDMFCDTFGHQRVPYLEPGKIHRTKKKSCIECFMP